MTPDFDAPQEGTPASADSSGVEPTLPDARVARDPAPDADAPEKLLDENLDATNVEDALRSRTTISVLASMASLDVAIPGGGAIQGLYDTLFRSKEMNDDFSISNLGGTLEPYFQFLKGEVDAEGRKIKRDGDDDDVGDQLREIYERRREIDREIAETFSENEIDAMPWVGDQNAVWTMDGISASRSTWLNAAKAVRKKLPQIAKDNNWTTAEEVDQQYWVSQYEAKIKEGDQAGAEAIKINHFKPETRQAVDEAAAHLKLDVERDKGISSELAAAGNATGSNATVSTDARADILAAASSQSSPTPAPVPPNLTPTTRASSGLSHPPEIELTETYNAVATAERVQPLVSPGPVVLADATPVKTSPAPLNQGFSI